MHDEMLMEEKKNSLKELIKQMYQLMMKGKGEEKMADAVPLAGKESPEEELLEDEVEDSNEGEISDAKEGLAKKVADAVGEEKADEGDLDPEEKSAFMRRGKTLPKMSGSMTVMKIMSKPKKRGMRS